MLPYVQEVVEEAVAEVVLEVAEAITSTPSYEGFEQASNQHYFEVGGVAGERDQWNLRRRTCVTVLRQHRANGQKNCHKPEGT